MLTRTTPHLKKLLGPILLAGLLLILVFSFVNSNAKADTDTTFFTFAFIFNPSETVTTTVTMDLYRADGSIHETVVEELGPLQGYTYNETQPYEFDGSAIIHADAPIVAMSNMLGQLGGSGLTSYRAGDSGLEVFLPYLTRYDQERWTWINVQNTSITETHVLIEYSDGYTRTAVVPPGSAATFDQRLEPHLGTRFSAVVTSDQPVSAVVVQEGQQKLWSYSGVVSPSTYPHIPLVQANDETNSTQIFVQNTGINSTDITMQYLPAQSGIPCTETQTIPAGGVALFAEAAFTLGTNSDCPAGGTFYGSGVVSENTTGQPLALVVLLFSTENARADAYTVLNPAEATNSVILPLLLNSCSGQYTFFGIQNVGTQPTEVNCVEMGGEYSVTQILAPGTSVITSQQGMLSCPFSGPGLCTATGGDALIQGVMGISSVVSSVDTLGLFEVDAKTFTTAALPTLSYVERLFYLYLPSIHHPE